LGYKYRALTRGGLDLAKKKVEKPKHELTKRQLSRWQQQEKRRRFILGSGIAVVVAVLGTVGVGVYNQWYVPEYKPLGETVIEVNGTKFDMSYYVKMLKFYGSGLSSQYAQLVATEVEKLIERDELVRQEAVKLGFSVSDDEVDKKLKSFTPPLSEDYREVVRAQLLLGKLSDEYLGKQVPVSAEQRHILAMFLEGEGQANEVRARLEAGEDFTQLASELSLDATCKEKKGDLGWRPKGVLPLLLGTNLVDEYAFSSEVGALSQPILDETKTKMVGYWLIKVLVRDEEAKGAKVKVMLLGSEQQASEVRAKLEAGEDFATLAKEFSQHDESRENGGDFDVAQEMVSEAFSKFTFSSELGVLSQPIRDDAVSTKGGCWLVKVSEVDNNRQIADEDRELLKADALNKWVEGLFDAPENKIESYLDEEKKMWAISHVLKD
jgi:parvulin-like peptidyl-prolyl isomerase